MTDDDDLSTSSRTTSAKPVPRRARRWKVAVIDDDPAVHDGTRFALYDYTLNGQGIEILSAHSAAGGPRALRAHPDIAVILLDVVMETDDAGLELVDYIRNELKNETVRIILRTGQPGQAPERRVIVDYDINDYKAKTELTADKLFTALTAALRSYQQLQRMVETRRGLEMIIDARLDAVRLQVDAAPGRGRADPDRLAAQRRMRAASWCCARAAGAGRSSPCSPAPAATATSAARRRRDALDAGAARAGRQSASSAARTNSTASRSVLYISTGSGREVVVLLEPARDLSRHRPGAGRGVLQPPLGRLRQRHSLRAAARGQCAARGAGREPHARADRRQ